MMSESDNKRSYYPKEYQEWLNEEQELENARHALELEDDDDH